MAIRDLASSTTYSFCHRKATGASIFYISLRVYNISSYICHLQAGTRVSYRRSCFSHFAYIIYSLIKLLSSSCSSFEFSIIDSLRRSYAALRNYLTVWSFYTSVIAVLLYITDHFDSICERIDNPAS